MRTTIDLPDDLFRALKARAALSGVTLRGLVRRLIEQGLRAPEPGQPAALIRVQPPPVIVAPRGGPIPAMPRGELTHLEEADDEAAWQALAAWLATPRVSFLNEPPGLGEWLRRWAAQLDPRGGQWTGAYLAAFAAAGTCRFVAFDADFHRYTGIEFLHLQS